MLAQAETRELSREEILAMRHPPFIDIDDIRSAHQTGGTVVYILCTEKKAVMPEELARRRHQFVKTSWQAVHHLRDNGVDI